MNPDAGADAGARRGEGGPGGGLSPFGRNMLERLGRAGPQGLEPARLGIRGAQQEFRSLAERSLAVELEGGIYLDTEAYRRLCRALLTNLRPGDELPIRQARERSGLSRRLLLPLLNRMERDGLVRRVDEVRRVLRQAPR